MWHIIALDWAGRVVHSQRYHSEQDAELEYEHYHLRGFKTVMRRRVGQMWCFVQGTQSVQLY